VTRAPEPLSFARQLDRLEEIVRQLEGQDLDLDAALKLFEEGVERLREAREQVLTDHAGRLKLEDFDG
jgi:exodeoxyribonuclease VII small subunit